jgi:hypothetical protein
MIKSKLDIETKMELLIKLAFGIPMQDLMNEYDLTKTKIINLRKNNYVLYNDFVNHWKIIDEVAVLGLTPKLERALSIVKKFYKQKIVILSESSIFYNGKPCTTDDIVNLADEILKKDNITNFKTLPWYIKNYY